VQSVVSSLSSLVAGGVLNQTDPAPLLTALQAVHYR
jgi:hypothetical protein